MDTSIYNELFQCNSGNLTPYRIKAGKHNRFRCVIHNQFYTCQLLQRTDISAFTSDDPSFHFIIGKLNHRNRGFSHLICGTSLNCIYNIVSRNFFRFLFCLIIILPDHHRCIMLDVLLYRLEKLGFCLIPGKTGDSFQLGNLLIMQVLYLCLLVF